MMIKEKKPLIWRHELKHSINKADDMEIAQRLSKLFKHDKHANSHGSYRVSSLYFDTPYDKALLQKINGVNRREKFRLRYYNEDLSFIRLEKKIKNNGLCGKYSAKMTLQEVELLLSGKIDFLLQSKEALFLEFYSKIRGQQLAPKTLVCYDREAFLYEPGNVRVTIDRNLRTTTNYLDFLNPDTHYADMSDQLSVLEVKYDAFLPEIVRLAVQIPHRQSAAFSKYAVCRRYD